jgi:hypothetical protein
VGSGVLGAMPRSDGVPAVSRGATGLRGRARCGRDHEGSIREGPSGRAPAEWGRRGDAGVRAGGRARASDGGGDAGGRAAWVGRERAAAVCGGGRRGWVIRKRSRRRAEKPTSIVGPRLGHMRHRDAAACSRPHACAARRRRPPAEELSLAGMATVLRVRLQLGALPP